MTGQLLDDKKTATAGWQLSTLLLLLAAPPSTGLAGCACKDCDDWNRLWSVQHSNCCSCKVLEFLLQPSSAAAHLGPHLCQRVCQID